MLRKLLDDARAAGAERIQVETNHDAGEAWIRAGFDGDGPCARGAARARWRATLGTEAAGAVVRGACTCRPTTSKPSCAPCVRWCRRLPGGSQGSVVLPPRDGWTSAYDELCDREPEMLRRLAKELSDRMGALVLALGVEEGAVVRYIALERGRVVDEYLSVPEFYGPLPPGEVIGAGREPPLDGAADGADPGGDSPGRADRRESGRASARGGAARPARRRPARRRRRARVRARAAQRRPRRVVLPTRANGVTRARSRPRSRPCGRRSRRRGRRPRRGSPGHLRTAPRSALGTGRSPAAASSSARSHRPSSSRTVSPSTRKRGRSRAACGSSPSSTSARHELEVRLGLDEAAHDAEGAEEVSVAEQHPGDDRVVRPPARLHRAADGEAGAPVLEIDARARAQRPLSRSRRRGSG